MQMLSEKEEDRLLYGKDYVSRPDDLAEMEKMRWRELEKNAHAEPNIETLVGCRGVPDTVPYHPAGKCTGYALLRLLFIKQGNNCYFIKKSWTQ